jgi:hypothetical protein
MTQLSQDGLKLAAQGLYKDMKKYVDSRRNGETKSASMTEGTIAVLKDMKEKMEQTPATETLSGSELHRRIISEKKRILSDLGVLIKVYDEIEKIDEHNGTRLLDRLEYL